MAAKRMRVFAGPNGSGKTTIFKEILNKEKINLGVYINADEIEIDLSSGKLNFDKFQIVTTNDVLRTYISNSGFATAKRNEPDLAQKLTVIDNELIVDTFIDLYLAAEIAEFIRQNLLTAGISFTFETVMSHNNKVQFLQKAKEAGFRVYLYFIATEDPAINVNRVKLRVEQLGHNVAETVIHSRYYKSLANLRQAITFSDRAYIFDNSGLNANLIAQITDGVDVNINDAVATPNWVVECLSN